MYPPLSGGGLIEANEAWSGLDDLICIRRFRAAASLKPDVPGVTDKIDPSIRRFRAAASLKR